MAMLPDDACPYARPFPKGFDECAAFERRAGSCANLTIGTYFDGANHHYGRCRLGDAATRMAMLKHHIVERDIYIDSFAGADGAAQPTPSIPPR
jgi:hypothetical protein